MTLIRLLVGLAAAMCGVPFVAYPTHESDPKQNKCPVCGVPIPPSYVTCGDCLYYGK